MELIALSGYTEQEKRAIAEQYLVPRQLRENGLLAGELCFTEEALQKIVRDYTREAGVRELERRIAQAARKVATEIAGDATENGARPTVTVDVECVAGIVEAAALWLPQRAGGPHR